ncbi:MAG: Ada metal-binding domain-containing protein [Marinoscillum sp.]
MLAHSSLDSSLLLRKIRAGEVQFAGNKTLRIYGLLSCKSGKRIRLENRVFFTTETLAIEAGFRPCGHCMSNQYQLWNSLRN